MRKSLVALALLASTGCGPNIEPLTEEQRDQVQYYIDRGLERQPCIDRFVEFADVVTILKLPSHPFTRAFLMSNPSMEMMKKIREKGMLLRGIPGGPPDMTEPPSGCVFHPRCPKAKDICRAKKPETKTENGHLVSCWLY